MSHRPTDGEITVRPLVESDLDAADRVMRLAFGTFLGLDPPERFNGDADYVHSRWSASPDTAFAAHSADGLIGSNFVTRWGSFGFLGPLTVHPAHWDRGVASALLRHAVALFDDWGVSHAGLFTFAHSAKHIGLYQKFGFRPGALTVLMCKEILTARAAPASWTGYASLDRETRAQALAECRLITDAIYPGLDSSAEIESIRKQALGDSVLLYAEGRVAAFAACHCGAASEAGSERCYIKFAAVAPGPQAERDFASLLHACEAFAADARTTHLIAGMNVARRHAYEQMLRAGFRIDRTGLAMHRPNEPGFNRPEVFVVDDWR